ncbi:MAG TPA: hypothetical protein VNQ74_05010, partial [Burkholderiaceae bacterium]|nr:hypothetical protein [Burkholderiaceae bacterium]
MSTRFGSAFQASVFSSCRIPRFDEIQAVLTAIDRSTADGRRDYALLATMFNTGARVQEIVAVRVLDVR